jgi:hypothetical protein
MRFGDRHLASALLLGANLLTACASGHNYACSERTVATSNPMTGGSYPTTAYSFCPCPEDKPCPELDIRNRDKPVLIIRRVPPSDDN